jgi:hypothetical protein
MGAEELDVAVEAAKAKEQKIVQARGSRRQQQAAK